MHENLYEKTKNGKRQKGLKSMRDQERLDTTMDLISGTERLIASSTPALKVIDDMGHEPQLPTNSRLKT